MLTVTPSGTQWEVGGGDWEAKRPKSHASLATTGSG